MIEVTNTLPLLLIYLMLFSRSTIGLVSIALAGVSSLHFLTADIWMNLLVIEPSYGIKYFLEIKIVLIKNILNYSLEYTSLVYCALRLTFHLKTWEISWCSNFNGWKWH